MEVELIMKIVLVVSVALFMLWKIEKEGLRKVAIDLISMAERTYKKGENTTKLNFVYKKLHDLLPIFLQGIISEKAIKKFIEDVFSEIKIALDSKPPEQKE